MTDPVRPPLAPLAPLDPSSPAPARLLSLDALRGFDMIWILGLEDIVHALARMFPDVSLLQQAAHQLEHVDWEGFRFYDLIFPLFLFLSGVSMAASLPRRLVRDGRVRTIQHLLVRGVILFLVGVVYSDGLSAFTGDLPAALADVRWMGVLQRIAIGSVAAGILSLFLGTWGLAVAATAILAGYWLLLTYVPVGDYGAGDFSEGRNLTNHLDRLFLPGRKYDGDHDPEGLLSTLPAIATALLGLLTGKALFAPGSVWKKSAGMLTAGAALVALGWAWHPAFPIIKKLWTSSFVLMAAGWSLVLLGAFHAIIEGIGLRRWATPFVWIGANPIALYVASGLGFFHIVAERLVGSPQGGLQWMQPTAVVLLVLLTARWLFRRGIHIRF
ncbi:MAG: hypothetical protein KF774_03760 [Planctomyces sp.]|nr:hypothetical protein [Planctomyces sp.]